jgi:hypothetical protein
MRVWRGLIVVAAIATVAQSANGQPSAKSAPPASATAATAAPVVVTPADAAKARRAALRSCKLRCDQLYPVTLRIIGEGTTLQKPEITGDVAANDMCKRGCDAGAPPS